MRSLTVFVGRVKYWASIVYDAAENKYKEQFGYRIRDTTVTKIVQYMYTPKDSSSLAVTRILFGLAMILDIPDERGGAVMEKRWGNPETCHFPLIPFIKAVPLPYMAVVYGALWLGALGITLGYKYQLSSITFTACYWYLFLIEKSFWNNHSYLFGLVSLLLIFTEASCYWSMDVYIDNSRLKKTVPYWNYFILKYQFFILYFIAGLKKGTAEWLTGYSVQHLSEHWVFTPFRLFLSEDQTNYLVVHWFVFVFDLTVAIWMMWSRTRHLAMVFCSLFHLMNSRLFRIGMFPWVCLATMPLFYPFHWPKIVLKFRRKRVAELKRYIEHFRDRYVKREICKTGELKEKQVDGKDDETNRKPKNNVNKKKLNIEFLDTSEVFVTQNVVDDQLNKVNKRRNLTCLCILFHVISQGFLPYSHFITKGYNNWANGLYGYSWDMMVHTWDIYSVVVKVIDNSNKQEFYIDPYYYAPNDRWTRHGDMVYQYAHCLRDRIVRRWNNRYPTSISDNISIYIDVWCSMNGRFTQRMFDPHIDMLQVSWSPFEPITYLLPMLDNALHWRSMLKDISNKILSENKNSDVIFFADLPGNFLNYKYACVLKSKAGVEPRDLEYFSLVYAGKQVGGSSARKRKPLLITKYVDGCSYPCERDVILSAHPGADQPLWARWVWSQP